MKFGFVAWSQFRGNQKLHVEKHGVVEADTYDEARFIAQHTVDTDDSNYDVTIWPVTEDTQTTHHRRYE